MSTKTITALPAVATPARTSVLPVDEGGTTTKKMTVAQVAGLVLSTDLADFDTAVTALLAAGGAPVAATFLDLAVGAAPSAPNAGHVDIYARAVHGLPRLGAIGPDGFVQTFSRDAYLICLNSTGGAIAKGKAVYVSGASGTSPTIALARADSQSTLPVLGLAAETIADGAYGRVLISGALDSIDTSAWSAGARVYLDPTSAGMLTATRPSLPNLTQRVGTVLNVDPTNGSVYVSPQAVHGEDTGTTAASFSIGGHSASGTEFGYLAGVTSAIQTQIDGKQASLGYTAANAAALNASALTSGTVPDARFPSVLPAVSGANLTNLAAASLTGALPALDGSALTSLNPANLSAAVAATKGGTGQTSWTLGDLPYSSAANTISKLAGNTTSAKQFLTQTGTGTISAAPAWGTIAAADLPNHSAALLTSGTVDTARLGSGAASSSTYLRGDQTWATISAGGPGTGTAGALPKWATTTTLGDSILSESSGAITLAGGTVTTAVSPLTITQTWNASGITFPGVVINVTNTASAAASKIFDFQVGGSTRLALRKDGTLQGNDGSTGFGLASTTQNSGNAQIYILDCVGITTRLRGRSASAYNDLILDTVSGTNIIFDTKTNTGGEIYVGNGATASSPASTYFGATGGSGSNIAGAELRLRGGLPTGNAVPGRVSLLAAPLGGASGSTLATAVDRLVAGATKTLTNNTDTALVNCTLASNTVTAGAIRYAVEVFDGTDLQIEEGVVVYHATNKGGAIANNSVTKSGNQQAMTAGTLAVTFSVTAANPAVVKVNANSSLTPSTGYPRITYTLSNLTQQSVSVQ